MKLTLIHKKTTLVELIEYFKPKLQFFVQHNFVARCLDGKSSSSKIAWGPFHQTTLYLSLTLHRTIPLRFTTKCKVCTSFHIRLVFLCIFVCNMHNPDANPYGEETWLLMEYHFYITEDKHHDTEMVQYCFNLHWNYLMLQNSPKTPLCVEWQPDGCATQFKSSKLNHSILFLNTLQWRMVVKCYGPFLEVHMAKAPMMG